MNNSALDYMQVRQDAAARVANQVRDMRQVLHETVQAIVDDPVRAAAAHSGVMRSAALDCLKR